MPQGAHSQSQRGDNNESKMLGVRGSSLPPAPTFAALGQSCHSRDFLLSRTASWCQEHLGQVTYSQLMVPPGLPKPASCPDKGSKYRDVLPIHNAPSRHLSPDNLAASSQKVGLKPVPGVPLGTSSGRPSHHLHTVPKSSGAWLSSSQQTENSKIRRRSETSKARQTDIRRSDRWQVSSMEGDGETTLSDLRQPSLRSLGCLVGGQAACLQTSASGRV